MKIIRFREKRPLLPMIIHFYCQNRTLNHSTTITDGLKITYSIAKFKYNIPYN